MCDSDFDSDEDATERTSLLMTNVSVSGQPNGSANPGIRESEYWEPSGNGNVQGTESQDSSTVSETESVFLLTYTRLSVYWQSTKLSSLERKEKSHIVYQRL